MDRPPPRILFMGTPAFAVASLDRLIQKGFLIAGVVTAPDRPAGRGRKVRFSAVKQYLLDRKQEIPLLQPENLKDPGFLQELSALQPDLQVVVAFRMLPEVVWSLPRLGTVNLHASLLPQYRGAAPINHVIINGEKETGVTTFMIDAQIDTGKILLQERTPVEPGETAGALHDRLMTLGADLLVETVTRLTTTGLPAMPQEALVDSGTELKKAPKITRDFCRIDWNRSAGSLSNLIRGLSPYPAAFTTLVRPGGEQLLCKIFEAEGFNGEAGGTPGTISTDGRKELRVAASGGYLMIRSLQPEGRRRMEVGEFLAGIDWLSGLFRFS